MKVKVVTPEGEIFHVPAGSKMFNDRGEEIPDPTPLELPFDCERPESLESMMMRMVMQVSHAMKAEGHESIDEANDFEVDDDDNFEDLLTGAELDAISTARELREEVPRGYEDGDSDERSGSAGSGKDSGEDDERAGQVAGSRGSRERDSEGDFDGAERSGSERVSGRREERSDRVEAGAASARKGVDRAKRR